jgi:hypothetical protein
MIKSTSTPTNYWSKTEARQRIRQAAALARDHSRMGIPKNARIEIGERLTPQYITIDGWQAEAITHDLLWESDLMEFETPATLRGDRHSDVRTRSQAMGVGYVCHLYFTGVTQWGEELLDVITVWLGDTRHEPQVVR